MKIAIAIIACLVTISGCKESEEQRLLTVANAAKKSIAERYKDPETVLFKNLQLDWQQQHICGELNAKNGYGGYNGYERFRADLKGVGADTVVTSLWTHRARLNQIFDDNAAGRITDTEANNARLKTIFDATCTDPEGGKSSLNLPSKS